MAAIRPIVYAPVRIGPSTATFYLADREITLHVSGKLIRELVAQCTGEQTLGELEAELEQAWDRSAIRRLIRELIRRGALVDCGAISRVVWPYVENPARFAPRISDRAVAGLVRRAHKRHRSRVPGPKYAPAPTAVGALLLKRASARRFGAVPVSRRDVISLLWSTYGAIGKTLPLNAMFVDRHVVPSAGALFPLRVSLAVFRGTPGLSPGVYDVRCAGRRRVGLVKQSQDPAVVQRCFAEPLALHGPSGVVVISGSFGLCEEKYGNRALLYVPLEAGHAAQNLHLTAAELGLASVEIGGFFEGPLRDALSLSEAFVPLTTIFFGHPAAQEDDPPPDDSLEVRWTPPRANGYTLPFSMAFARVRATTSVQEWACGRSPDPAQALAKASAEAVEWAACGVVPTDLLWARWRELKGAIDPRDLIRYHPAQYRRENFPLTPFSPDQRYAWQRATVLRTGCRTFVLADCVYFPYQSPVARYAFANSSGAAAHPDRGTAVQNAVLEVVERDAFMVAWLNRLSMPTIQRASLPGTIRERLCALEDAGFAVVVKDITLDLTPVLLVTARNDRLPLTTCAACSAFSPEEALDHALQEVEAAAYCRLASGTESQLKANEVQFTDDHGRLYAQRRYYRRADFLAAGSATKPLRAVARAAPRSWAALIDANVRRGFEPVIVDLAPKPHGRRSQTYAVVKAFVPGLIPMTFGYGLEPLGMERLYRVPQDLRLRPDRPTYRALTTFPHPYT